jgi:hypothetical protein
MNESLDRVHPTIRTKACKSIASLAVSAALVMALENVGHTVVLLPSGSKGCVSR